MSGITWTGVPGNAGDPIPPPVTVASGAVYDARNALTSLNMLGVVETRQFNVLGQLTRITQAGAIDIEYRFSATANDGKITSQKNWISGEEVVYQYDELERLSSATTTGQEWGLSWSYDGFGNRLSQSVTKGSGPTSTTLVDPTTNRLSSAGFAYDSNGNMTAMPQLNSTLDYDRSNRATTVSNSNGSFQYAYAPDNRRIWFKTANNDPFDFSLNNGERFVLYSTGGQKMGTYKLDTSGGPTDPLGFFAIEENVYWGGKLVARHNANAGGALQRAIQDRLSSEGTFFPFGEYRSNSSTMGGAGREAFATYTRDSQTGLDYADQRYYAAGLGRFANPDPFKASSGGNGDTNKPLSWNRYRYVLGDPMNWLDPRGLHECSPDMTFCITKTEELPPGSLGPGGLGGGGGTDGPGGHPDVESKPEDDQRDVGGAGVTFAWSNVRWGMESGEVVNAFHNVHAVLSSDKNCRDFFASSSSGSLNRDNPNALIAYIDSFLGQTATGTPSDRDSIAQTVPAPVGGYRIFINRGGAFFNKSANRLPGDSSGVKALLPGGTRAQAFILLHELAHALGALGGWIDADALSYKDTVSNNDLLMFWCGEGLAKLTP